MLVVGTRPEAIKVAPVVRMLEASTDFCPILVSTGQHAEMLTETLGDLELKPSVDLALFAQGRGLPEMTGVILGQFSNLLGETRPDIVVVQGDTTSAFSAGLACYYEGIDLAHLEGGLRTSDPRVPFPEEMNRRLTSQLANLHLVPTARAKANLAAEGIVSDVVVTGNTVIDALLWASERSPLSLPIELSDILDSRLPFVLVTLHRRESWGPPMMAMATAISAVARRHPDWRFVVPLHRNPDVRGTLEPILCALPNVVLTEPLPYRTFCHAMAASSFVLTDSGGIQEEAPSLGKPVLVLRDNTERPEGIASGTAALVGTDPEHIEDAVNHLISNRDLHTRMAKATNPYGDGSAAERVLAALRWRFRGGARPDEFRPTIDTGGVPAPTAGSLHGLG